METASEQHAPTVPDNVHYKNYASVWGRGELGHPKTELNCAILIKQAVEWKADIIHHDNF